MPTASFLEPGSKISRAASQVWPPSVVRENQAGPVPLFVYRVQAAYASSELVGSAVIDCLSLPAEMSVISAVGAPQFRPPSVDLLTRMALGFPCSGKSCAV